MLVGKTLIRAFRSYPTIISNFARKKSNRGGDDDQEGGHPLKQKQNTSVISDEQAAISEKLVGRSAALYEHYLKSRQRPMLTSDNHQVRFVYVIQRSPIFVPFHKKKFEYYRTVYQNQKKSGYYKEVPKELQVQTGDYLFTQYQRVNPQNQITHRNTVSRTEVYQYSEHARYWKYTDPNITDPHSVQAYSSDNVFFIVKNKNGAWQFPGRLLSEKDNYKEIFTVINNEIFAGSPNPIVHFSQTKPIYVRKIDEQSSGQGVGVYEYFYKGLSLNGIPKFPTENFSDYAWVPKPLLSKYFQDKYFEETIKLAVHLC